MPSDLQIGVCGSEALTLCIAFAWAGPKDGLEKLESWSPRVVWIISLRGLILGCLKSVRRTVCPTVTCPRFPKRKRLTPQNQRPEDLLSAAPRVLLLLLLVACALCCSGKTFDRLRSGAGVFGKGGKMDLCRCVDLDPVHEVSREEVRLRASHGSLEFLAGKPRVLKTCWHTWKTSSLVAGVS